MQKVFHTAQVCLTISFCSLLPPLLLTIIKKILNSEKEDAKVSVDVPAEAEVHQPSIDSTLILRDNKVETFNNNTEIE